MPVTPWNIIAVVIALRAIAALTALLLCASPVGAQTEVEKPPAVEKPAETTPAPSKFRGDDGWFDVSGFLDEKYGFLPIVEVGSAWARP